MALEEKDEEMGKMHWLVKKDWTLCATRAIGETKRAQGTVKDRKGRLSVSREEELSDRTRERKPSVLAVSELRVLSERGDK